MVVNEFGSSEKNINEQTVMEPEKIYFRTYTHDESIVEQTHAISRYYR